MKSWIKKYGAYLSIYVIYIVCGYGHMLFDSDNGSLAIFSNIGDKEFCCGAYSGARTFWVIYDASQMFAWFTFLISLPVFVFCNKREVAIKAAIAFALLSLISLWDFIQAVVLFDGTRYNIVEILILTVATVYVAVSIEIIPVPNFLKIRFNKLATDFIVSFKHKGVKNILSNLKQTQYELDLERSEKMLFAARQQYIDEVAQMSATNIEISKKLIQQAETMLSMYEKTGSKECLDSLRLTFHSINKSMDVEIKRLTN